MGPGWDEGRGPKGGHASPPPHAHSAANRRPELDEARQRPLARIRKCLRPQQVGVWAGRWRTRGPSWISLLQIPVHKAPWPGPQRQQPCRPQDQAVSLPGVLAYGSVPSRTLRTGVPSGHILVTVCPLVTHLVPPMNLSSGSHLTRSSPSQGTFWRRPSLLGGNWCRVPQMWSPMET